MKESWISCVVLLLLVSGTLAIHHSKENEEYQFWSRSKYTEFLEFTNFPLTDPAYLWSYRWVEITTTGKGEFNVYYSTSQSAILKHIENSQSEENSISTVRVEEIQCVGFLQSKSSQESCQFALSFYGESPWWYPRIESALEAPPNTVVAIHSPGGSLGIITGGSERLFTVKVTHVSDWRYYAAVFALGVIFYVLAKPLSKSLTFYLLLWFFGGALMGMMTIVLCLFWFFSRQLHTGMTITSMVTLTFVGFATFWATSGFPTWLDLFTNKWALGLMALGGLSGLWKGYTDHLTKEQQSRTQLFLKLLSLGFIFNSIHQTEAGVLLVVSLLLLGIFPLHLLIYLFYPVLFPLFAIWNRIKWHILPKRKRKVITMEEYLIEGEVETKKALEELVQMYKRQPALLFDLSRSARRRLVKMIDDPHITTIAQKYDKKLVKRSKAPRSPSRMEGADDHDN